MLCASLSVKSKQLDTVCSTSQQIVSCFGRNRLPGGTTNGSRGNSRVYGSSTISCRLKRYTFCLRILRKSFRQVMGLSVHDNRARFRGPKNPGYDWGGQPKAEKQVVAARNASAGSGADLFRICGMLSWHGHRTQVFANVLTPDASSLCRELVCVSRRQEIRFAKAEAP